MYAFKSDMENLLFYSFRYALGRSTYAVNDVATLLIKYKDTLTKNTKYSIREEIREAISEKKAGMEIDKYEWERVLEEFKD